MAREMLISQFKAHCIAELKRVQRTGQPLIVTLRGRPIARVEPAMAPDESAVALGTKRGGAQLRRDLVGLDFAEDWEMNR